MKLIPLATAIFDRIVGVLAFLAGILTIFIMLFISVEVAARYFLRMPITGVTEISEFSLLWVVFLGAAWVLKKDRHVGIDTVLNRLRPKIRRIVNISTSLLGTIVSLVLFWYGLRVTLAMFAEGTMEQGMFHIQMAYVLVIIPIGSLPLLIQFLRRAYEYWKGLRETKTEGFL